MPAEDLRHDAGGERAHQRRDHPGGGEGGKDPRVQAGRVDTGHHHVERNRQRAAAEPLHEAARDEHRHGHGRARDDEAQHEQRHGGVQRGGWPASVRPVSGRHHADHAGGQRPGEGQCIQAGAVELAADDRHDGGHRQRFERREEHQGTRADGHPQVRSLQDPGCGVCGGEGGIAHGTSLISCWRRHRISFGEATGFARRPGVFVQIMRPKAGKSGNIWTKTPGGQPM